MKFRKPLLSTLAVGALFFTGTLLAQDTSPPAAGASPAPAPAQTQVTVQNAQTPAPTIGQAPSFEQLSGGAKWITEDQASAYPPLANDFLHASHNGKRVSKTQYEQWVKQLQ